MPDVPDPSQQPGPGQPPSAPTPAPEYTPGHMPITEEFDKAKWRLPPLAPVAIAAGVIVVIAALVSFGFRSKPVMTGSITKIARVDQEDNTIVAVQVELENVTDKQVWIRGIDTELQTQDGKRFTNGAAPASDVPGYLKALPALQEAKADPLGGQVKLPPRSSYTGVMVFSYPVDGAAFDDRKSYTVKIAVYDQPSLVLKQP
jgi:hypothetical protein